MWEEIRRSVGTDDLCLIANVRVGFSRPAAVGWLLQLECRINPRTDEIASGSDGLDIILEARGLLPPLLANHDMLRNASIYVRTTMQPPVRCFRGDASYQPAHCIACFP